MEKITQNEYEEALSRLPGPDFDIKTWPLAEMRIPVNKDFRLLPEGPKRTKKEFAPITENSKIVWVVFEKDKDNPDAWQWRLSPDFQVI